MASRVLETFDLDAFEGALRADPLSVYSDADSMPATAMNRMGYTLHAARAERLGGVKGIMAAVGVEVVAVACVLCAWHFWHALR